MSKFKLQILNSTFISHWKLEIGNWKFPQGFTLIEMLLVFTLIGTLTAAGLSAFFSQSRSQTFNTTVSDVSHVLNQLRSRALSRVKPPECGTAALEGYEFSYTTGGTSYRTQVRCGGTYHSLSDTNLPTNITFGTGTITFFQVGTGIIAQPVTITLTGNDKTASIRIETTGVISVQ